MMGFSTGKALCIGIAKYPTRPLPALISNDARDIAALLCDPAYCGYPPTDVRVLLDHDATKADIDGGLTWLAASAAPNDTVVIFFSGHGAKLTSSPNVQGCLLPIDFDIADLPATSITGSKLTAAVNKIKAQRVVILLDACHAGGTGDPKTVGTLPIGLGASDYDELAKGAGRIVIASSQPEEFSWALPGMSNSVFTDALLRALRGEAAIRGDGLVRVLDVFHSVANRVPALEPRQHPLFKAADLSQNFPLALYRGGLKGQAQSPPPMPRDDSWWRDLETLVCNLYPAGPTDTEVWSRAGGDVAQLRASQSARGAWHNAIEALRRGGGGKAIGVQSFLDTITADFALNPEINRLRTT